MSNYLPSTSPLSDNDLVTIRQGGELVTMTALAARAYFAAKSAVVLASSGAPVSLTGSTGATQLANIAVPANALGANGELRIFAQASWPNNANSKTLTFSFGGQTVITTTQTTNQGMQIVLRVHNRGVQNAQSTFPSINSFSQTGTAPTYLSVDTTQVQSLVITGQLGVGTDTMVLENYTVELING